MGKLSYMKIGKKEFHLVVGDEFFTNGHVFSYIPSTPENIGKCGKSTDRWRPTTTISVPKIYKEAILLKQCENLEIIKQEGEYIHWKVASVDNVVIEKTSPGELWYIGIKIRETLKDKELFTTHISTIKERTKKMIVLEKDLNYRSSYNVDEYIDKILWKSGPYGTDRLAMGDDFAVFIEVPTDSDAEKMEKIDQWKDKLHQAMKQKLENELSHAQNNLSTFEKLSQENGY